MGPLLVSGAPEKIGQQLCRLVVASLLRLSRNYVALGTNAAVRLPDTGS